MKSPLAMRVTLLCLAVPALLALLGGHDARAADVKPAAPAASPWTIDSDPERLTAAARAGDAAAQYALGLRLWIGPTARKDINAAIIWFSRSAAQDYPLASTALGVIYDEGDGVSADPGKAAYQYRLAADNGEALAQYRLGLLAMHGRGLPQDYATAARWFKAAAEQGLPDAENNLGYLLALGLGVPRDSEAAAGWYAKAAKAGSEEAQANLAELKAPSAATGSASRGARVETRRRTPAEIAAELEAHPADDGEFSGEFGATRGVEISSKPADDGRLSEIRVALAHGTGPHWFGYRIYPGIAEAARAYAKYGKTPPPAAAAATLETRAFTVGLLSANRPFTLHCAQTHDTRTAPEKHEVGCAYFEPDAPIVFVAGAVVNYKHADNPPDEVWQRVGGLAAVAYRHAHRLLGLGTAVSTQSRPGG